MQKPEMQILGSRVAMLRGRQGPKCGRMGQRRKKIEGEKQWQKEGRKERKKKRKK